MGWICEHNPEHEGFLVGLEEREAGTRELNYRDDGKRRKVACSKVQVACSCGWRSKLLTAPPGTIWYPCAVELPSAYVGCFDDLTRMIWHDQHVMIKTSPELGKLAERCGVDIT